MRHPPARLNSELETAARCHVELRSVRDHQHARAAGGEIGGPQTRGGVARVDEERAGEQIGIRLIGGRERLHRGPDAAADPADGERNRGAGGGGDALPGQVQQHAKRRRPTAAGCLGRRQRIEADPLMHRAALQAASGEDRIEVCPAGRHGGARWRAMLDRGKPLSQGIEPGRTPCCTC